MDDGWFAQLSIHYCQLFSRPTTLRFKVSSCNSSWNEIRIRSVLPQTIGHAMNDFTNGTKLFLNGWWLIRTTVYCQLFLPSTEVEHSLNLQVFELKSSLNVSCVRDAVKYEKAPLKGWGGECYRPKIDHTCAEAGTLEHCKVDAWANNKNSHGLPELKSISLVAKAEIS